MYGEYYDRGKRPYRPVKRRPPTAEEMPDAETAALIREAIVKYPKATAEEVRIFVAELDGGPEFDVKAIRAVMHFG
ncbi:MAG: hypothetical protein ACRDQ0_08825 [Pseudonocardia sp.]